VQVGTLRDTGGTPEKRGKGRKPLKDRARIDYTSLRLNKEEEVEISLSKSLSREGLKREKRRCDGGKCKKSKLLCDEPSGRKESGKPRKGRLGNSECRADVLLTSRPETSGVGGKELGEK